MVNLHIVESIKSFGRLYKYAPNFSLLEVSSVFLTLLYFLVKVAAVGHFHDDAK